MTSLSDNTVVNTPGGMVELAYLQLGTANFAITAGNNSYIGGTATAVCDGSPIIVECFLPRVDLAATADFYVVFEMDGTASGRVGNIYNPGTQIDAESLYMSLRLTPSAGVHTFRVRGYSTTSTTTIVESDGVGTNIIQPYLRISKVVQASQFIVPLASASLVTSLPSAPIDGQEIRYLADATNGVIWNLRYRAASSSSYKWEFIGGSQLYSISTGSFQTTSSTFQVWSTGPTITVPIAGIYEITLSAVTGNQSASVNTSYAAVAVNGTVSTAYDGVWNTSSGQWDHSRGSIIIRKTLAANDVLTVKTKSDNNVSTANTDNGVLTVQPVRVG